MNQHKRLCPPSGSFKKAFLSLSMLGFADIYGWVEMSLFPIQGNTQTRSPGRFEHVKIAKREKETKAKPSVLKHRAHYLETRWKLQLNVDQLKTGRDLDKRRQIPFKLNKDQLPLMMSNTLKSIKHQLSIIDSLLNLHPHNYYYYRLWKTTVTLLRATIRMLCDFRRQRPSVVRWNDPASMRPRRRPRQ